MLKTPKGLRCHIGIFGRRNVGKSNILNSLTSQNISIVSDIAGTTTDPVEKGMELQPIGPVLFVDTAGIDDVGVLGNMRVEKTFKVFDRTDVAILVIEPDIWGEFEDRIIEEFKKRNISFIVAINKIDLKEPAAEIISKTADLKVDVIHTSALEKKGINRLKKAIVNAAPEEYINAPTIIGDLIPPGGLAVLVVPIDKEAPKGRLILPQVQTIRDILDSDSYCMVVKERELRDCLDSLKEKPDIVVTDSQAFLKVTADVPADVKLTSFSILFARFKGDLVEQVKGALTIEHLKSGDRVLICESCTHHPIADDIGRVKIPRWLTQYVGGKLNYEIYSGRDFPDNIEDYKLIIHCGACMWNRRSMLTRIIAAKEKGVPITNYGLTIAYSLGIFDRALEPFPYALQEYKETLKKLNQ
ncbi:MAG: [FeFe] hydrogenase H-cluster maturation GTPase HydF [Cyanobacteriota bacterium]